MDNIFFGIIDLKSRFEELLQAGEIPEGSIILIQDTSELWVHGTYIKSQNIKIYNGLDQQQSGMALDATQGTVLKDMVNNLRKIVETEVGTPESVKQSHVTLTQEEYDQRLEEGLILDDVFYYIIETEE